MRHAIARTLLVLVSLVISTACSLHIAQAGDRSFSVGSQSLRPLATAVNDTDLVLPESGGPGFQLSFVLPRDYVLNSVVRVHIYARGSGTCSANLVVLSYSTIRVRVGRPITASSSGITPQDGTNAISFVASGTAAQKVFLIRRATDGSMAQQRAGDGLRITFFRDPFNPLDTCTGDVRISHVDVRYTSIDP